MHPTRWWQVSGDHRSGEIFRTSCITHPNPQPFHINYYRQAHISWNGVCVCVCVCVRVRVSACACVCMCVCVNLIAYKCLSISAQLTASTSSSNPDISDFRWQLWQLDEPTRESSTAFNSTRTDTSVMLMMG